MARGDADGAFDAYRYALTACNQLALTNPNAASWQHDHAVTQEKIGDVLLTQGNTGEALEAYRASLVIRERFAEANPVHVGCQRDVAVSCMKIASATERNSNSESRIWWQRAYEILSSLKAGGMHLSPQDEGALEYLRRTVHD